MEEEEPKKQRWVEEWTMWMAVPALDRSSAPGEAWRLEEGEGLGMEAELELWELP